jgi:hypothetical protein
LSNRIEKDKTGGTSATPVTDEKFTDVQLESDSLKGDQLEDEDGRRNIILRGILKKRCEWMPAGSFDTVAQHNFQ